MKVINPATEQVIADYRPDSADQVQQKLQRAAGAFVQWRTRSFAERAKLMRGAAVLLRERRTELAELMANEMGKPLTAGEGEINKCAQNCDFYADHAEVFLKPQEVKTDATRSYVRYDPLGPVLAIMPWNFPFWQVFRFASPALMAGNVGILKHSANVPGCAMAIEKVFRDAGFPDGAFTTLLIPSSAIEDVIAHPVIQAVTLTGSEAAGMAVAAAAGKVLKKTVLELGGSDPFIVIPPADGQAHLNFIRGVAAEAAKARCINSGQSCIAAKRFIVVGWAEAFEQAMALEMAKLISGDPMDRQTEVGPMAREDLLGSLDDQVQRSIAAGAYLLTGGHRLDRKGYFYAPTVLGRVRPGMAVFDEETFGPVAAVISAKDVDEAVALANLSPYGLGASIWTEDVALAERIAPRIEAGNVFINGPVKSDPRLPFGGVKKSGYGRELSAEGIREFVNIKTVWVK